MVEYSGVVLYYAYLAKDDSKNIISESIARMVSLPVSRSVDVMTVFIPVPYIIAQLFHYVVTALSYIDVIFLGLLDAGDY